MMRLRFLAMIGIMVVLLPSMGCTSKDADAARTKVTSVAQSSERNLDPLAAAKERNQSVIPTSVPTQISETQAIQTVRDALDDESPRIVASLVAYTPSADKKTRVCWAVLAFPVEPPPGHPIGQYAKPGETTADAEGGTSPQSTTRGRPGEQLIILDASTGDTLFAGWTRVE